MTGARLGLALAFGGVAYLAARTAGHLGPHPIDGVLAGVAVGLAGLLGGWVAPRLAGAPSAGAAVRRGAAWAVWAGALIIPVWVIVFFVSLFTIGHGRPPASFWASAAELLAVLVLCAVAVSPVGGLAGWAVWRGTQPATEA